MTISRCTSDLWPLQCVSEVYLSIYRWKEEQMSASFRQSFLYHLWIATHWVNWIIFMLFLSHFDLTFRFLLSNEWTLFWNKSFSIWPHCTFNQTQYISALSKSWLFLIWKLYYPSSIRLIILMVLMVSMALIVLIVLIALILLCIHLLAKIL